MTGSRNHAVPATGPQRNKLEAPITTIAALRLVQAALEPQRWAAEIVDQSRRRGALAFSRQVLVRFDTRNAPGARSARFARQLIPQPLPIDQVELVVSPYAPPMRQLSSVRQGVPMWSSTVAASDSAVQTPPAARAPVAERKPRPAAPKQQGVSADLLAILNMHRALGHIDE